MEPSMILNNLLILLTIFSTVSCGLLERRDFSSQMDYRFDEPLFKPNDDFMVMAGDSGRDYDTYNEIMEKTPSSGKMNSDYRYDRSLERELRYLEQKLSDSEHSEYTRFKGNFGSRSEKIYFLRLPASEKRDYLSVRKIESNSNSISYSNYRNQANSRSAPRRRSIASSVRRAKDITLGMNQDDALQSWGTPERRDIDGNPSDRNERWAYRRNGRVKYIYFESGKVQGWAEQ
jgi:hypothetical protein